ncbi:trehalose-phosphatase-domain-containing protein [Tribonema minus]|uniref:Trehalose-phosphatase-domain-containing protein n=1 Tax=Tribonema minus TaxID=303371 RepID=A0A835ZEL8_9STRA|nr:trehalose-phosphatase-domain-containing protein [Tribonema minus]
MTTGRHLASATPPANPVASMAPLQQHQRFHHQEQDLGIKIEVPQARQGRPKRERCLSVGSTNLLDNFHVLESLLKSRRLVLLLDYDGTLTPIVRDTLRALPSHFVTGIVTGRSLAKIRNFVDVPGIIYAGSHGYDILAPEPPSKSGRVAVTPPRNVGRDDDAPAQAEARQDQNQQEKEQQQGNGVAENGCAQGGRSSNGFAGGGPEGVRYQVAGEFLPAMQQIRQELEEAVGSVPGAEVEDNTYSISVHYRNCPRREVPRVREIVGQVQASHKGIRLRHGKEVFELQPDVHWNKGCAVVWMLEMLGLSAPASESPTDSGSGEGVHNGHFTEGGDVHNGFGLRNVRSHSAASSHTGDTCKKCEGAALSRTSSLDSSEPRLFRGERCVHGMQLRSQHEDTLNDEDEDAVYLSICQQVFTIFIGDDKADEDAFQVFTGESSSAQQPGLGILVSEESRATHAAYTLKNPQEVAELLSRLVSIGQSRSLQPARVCTCAGPHADGSTGVQKPEGLDSDTEGTHGDSGDNGDVDADENGGGKAGAEECDHIPAAPMLRQTSTSTVVASWDSCDASAALDAAADAAAATAAVTAAAAAAAAAASAVAAESVPRPLS